MNSERKIKKALISVYYKDNLDSIVKLLHKFNVELFSTGGTLNYIESLNVPVSSVESLTNFPEILGGRVKTLHPKIFGGILSRREEAADSAQLETHTIPEIDLVIVDLYPFEETVNSGANEKDIIEKIDIGGISLIRAAAKNFNDVFIVPSRKQYEEFIAHLSKNGPTSTLTERKRFAAHAFAVSSNYDTQIFNYFNQSVNLPAFRASENEHYPLRYGENPHQEGTFYGNLNKLFEKLNGKELSYNNLLDIDAAVNLINDFDETCFAILKHNNACGIACRQNLIEAWKDALAADPLSAFGGVLITNSKIDFNTAEEITKLFFEVIIAPDYDENALLLLCNKPNRIVLRIKERHLPEKTFRTLLNGILFQDKDLKTETINDLKLVTKKSASEFEINDLLFANKVVKHTKSNTIVLAKNNMLISSGTGQTSRVDALKQAIAKAKNFGFKLSGAVMASDAFFPFADCVELANQEKITAVIQPGGSIKDKDSIDYCDTHGMSMYFTGVRHFKH